MILILCVLNGLFTLIWYLYWRREKQHQEDIVGGPVIPLFYPPTVNLEEEAPRCMTPGEVRYFVNMSYDAQQFAAEVVNMGVKGLLTIDYKPAILWGSGTYTLIKKRDYDATLDAPIHEVIMEKLFAKTNSIQLTQTNQATLQEVTSKLNFHFSYDHGNMFISHPLVIMMPALVGALCFFLALLMDQVDAFAFFGIAMIFYVFAGIWGHYITKTYTPEGCKLKHQILGFKLFLAATETDRLEVIGTPPIKTPELYEKYLPYAIALDVEKQWTRQFAAVFAQLEQQGVHYQPLWYHGQSFAAFDPATFTTQISNSLQSAIQSSGGGGRGGGSSGGGRGGGGGGSW